MALSQPIQGKGYHLYSSPELSLELLECKTFAIGTARTNRKYFPKLQAGSLNRGEHISASIFDETFSASFGRTKNLSHLYNPDDTTTVTHKHSDGS